MSEVSKGRSTVFMVIGIFMAIFGIIALFSPISTGGAVVKIVSLVLVVTGVLRLAQAIKSERKAETILSSIMGAVICGLGILVWMNPELGSAFLTVLLTIFFVSHGLWKISAAFSYRQYPIWGWMLISGLLSLLLAWFMWKQSPLSGAWAIGIWVGLDVLITGLVTIALAFAMKRGNSGGSVDTISL
jgi:uncharacterized membrane protein HdeD (DUF308 family)